MPPTGRSVRRPCQERFSRYLRLAILPHFIFPEDTRLLPDAPHVVIATPCYGGQLTMAYVDSVLRLQAACIARAIRIDFDLRANEALITRARNDLAARFLASTASHLMFIDADIGFAPEQFFRLLDFNAEVTAAAYPLKHIDWDKVRRAAEAKRPDLEGSGLDYVVYFDNDEGTVTARNGFIRVRYAGTGFLLIQRGVLLRLCEAHPELRYRMVQRRADIDRDVPYQYSLFECMIDTQTGEYLSEDYAFCRRWLALGGEIWMDVKSRLTHYGANPFRGNLEAQFDRR
jgi:hypothetical protein